MARMVRKQLYLQEDLDRELAERARLLGVSQAELVRRAVELFLADERPGALESAVRDIDAAWVRGDALGVGSWGATWTRDELHER
jgi:hypothetical protein